MTVSVITGLVIQAVAIWLMHVGIRGRWISHIGAIFLASAVAYHGITEIVQWLLPGQNGYRRFIDSGQLDDWVLLVSIALLLYSAAYVFFIRRAKPSSAHQYFAGIKPRWLMTIIAPLVVLTAAGSAATAYQPQGTVKTGSTYVVGGIAEQFLVLIVGVAGAAFVAQRGVRYLLPTLLAECALLSLGGDRRSIVFGAVITLYGLTLAGVRLPRKKLLVGVACAVLLVLAVSASREVVGRGQFGEGQGVTDRGNALLAGAASLGSAEGWKGVRDETVYRLDGNTFGTLIDTSLQDAVPPVGLITVWNTVKLGIPTFIYFGKVNQPIEDRVEEVYLINHFAIGNVDYIPGFFGSVIGYFGRWGMLVIAILLGIVIAAADRFIRGRATPARLALGSGAVLAVLLYEQSLQAVVLNARGAITLAVLIWVALRLVRRREERTRPGSCAVKA
jgi:hypothetical protein